MTELLERGSETACRDVMIFGTGEQSVCADLVQQTVRILADEGTVGRLRVTDVTRASTPSCYAETDAGIFIFLLDKRFLSSAGGEAACCQAMRSAVENMSLIVPVLLDSSVRLESTAFAYLAPIRLASSANVAAGLAQLEKQILQYLEQPRPRDTTVLPAAASVAPSSMDDALAGTTQIAEVVDLLPCHMSIYDDFVEQLVSQLQVRRMKDEQRHLNLFSQALKEVLNAEMVYCYLRTSGGELHLFEADGNRPLHGCSAKLVHSVLEDALESFGSSHRARSLQLKNFLPELVPASGSALECTVVVNDKLAHCGVFIASRPNASRYPKTELIGTVINALHNYFTSSESRNFEKLKATVYDELKRVYRFVSDDMYQDRLRLFSNQISNLSVQFEPILHFQRERREVNVYAYEALAREHAAAVTAPVDVFDSAALWGMGFQSEVDKKLLKITLESYEQQLAAAQLSADAIKPLSLNVYPATLCDLEYREMLYRQLDQSPRLSGHNLIMEVSEKTVISPGMEGEPRKQLEEYRKLVRQMGELTGGIRYAIDDFGVGNASLSRLDSLNPHYVKIDRDILSFERRMASTLIRYLIESQPERGTSVILEGVDIHSSFKLSELVNELGVSLVQGYCLSKAVSNIGPQWEENLCRHAAEQVGWQAPLQAAAEAQTLH